MLDKNRNIVLGILIFWFIFALYKEYTEHDDSFSFYKNKDSDDIKSSIYKLKKCIGYDFHTIKWRRILICTAIVIFLLYKLVFNKIPNGKELLLSFFFIFFVFYISWKHYVHRTAKKAVQLCKKHLLNLENEIKKKHKFIF